MIDLQGESLALPHSCRCLGMHFKAPSPLAGSGHGLGLLCAFYYVTLHTYVRSRLQLIIGTGIHERPLGT